MATTQNGIYYQDDYTKNADILADMKEMAESVDEVVQDEKENQETIEQTIQEIQQEQTAQNKKIEQLDDNQIHITTEKAESINVQDCSGQNAKIKLIGISKQKTRTGKNEFNKSATPVSNSNATTEELETGVKVSSTIDSQITYVKYVIKDLSNFVGKVVRAKANIKSINNSTPRIVIGLTNSTGETSTITKAYTATSGNTISFTITEDDVDDKNCYLSLLLYGNIGAHQSGQATEYTDLVITIDNEDMSYEDFGASPSPEYPAEIENTTGNVDITVYNKNIFNSKNLEDTSIIAVNEDGSIALANNTNSTGYTNTGKKLKELCKGLKVGDVAHLKLITTFSNKGIYLQGSNSYSWTNEYSKTITEDMLEDVVIIYGGYQKTDTLQIQITKNSLEDYEMHEEQLITFPLKENQKMLEGSETEDDGIHHKRKQIELDGTENWNTLEEQNTENTIYITTADFDNAMSKTENSILCNIAKQGVVWDTDEGNRIVNQRLYSALRLRMWKKDFADINSWKTYLANQKTAGTPVTIEYPLAEETIEAYTTEQQEAYNQLQNAKTYKLVTNVFTENAELEMEYIADTKTYIDNKVNNMQNQLNTINELLSTTNTSALLLNNLQTDLESEVL